MAISHNLSDVTNNLTGFDVAAGLTEGTTYGKTYILWQWLQGLIAFDSAWKIITAGSPTPVFLQGEVGTFTTAPALNRSVATDYFTLYRSDDPGLSAGTPNCCVYRFTNGHNSTYVMCYPKLTYLKSGVALYNPAGVVIFSGTTSGYANKAVSCVFGGTTNTITTVTRKTIFWKSSHLVMTMDISKADGSVTAFQAYLLPHIWTGYISNAIISNGVNFHMTGALNAYDSAPSGSGWAFIAGMTSDYFESGSSVPDRTTLLPSAGVLPSTMFSVAGTSYLISGKLAVSAHHLANYKAISPALEGIIIANPSAVVGSFGATVQYNGVWYLVGPLINSGRSTTDTYRILFQLT